MIISKAIEILTISRQQNPDDLDPDTWNATMLGQEALKRIRNGRLHPFNPMYIPLPGETMPDRGVQAGLESRQSKKTKRA